MMFILPSTRDRSMHIAYGRIYSSINYATIGSDNGLSPARHQAIIRTNAVLLLIGINLKEI